MDFDGWMEALVGQIPRQKSTTAEALARALGEPTAGRAVEEWMGRHAPDVPLVPGGTQGVFEAFQGASPFATLRAEQRRQAKLVSLRQSGRHPTLLVGVDVAYQGRKGFTAAVVVDAATMDVLRTRVLQGEARFPYVPGYLYYREGPLVLPTMRGLGGEGTLFILDGHGVLHPRGCGMASHVGIVVGEGTLGIAKGPWRRDDNKPEGEWTALRRLGRTCGWLHWDRAKGHRRYVSPGHLTSVMGSREVATHLLGPGRTSPVDLADAAARRARRRENTEG